MVIFLVSAPSLVEPIAMKNEWHWTPDRRLDDRQCVMNLFIERQPPDEFNPDFVKPPKDAENGGKDFKQPPPEIAEGTYRTKGQMTVITRLIEAVANSFRSKIHLQQHIIFTGTRDGGQLAELALKHWPPRGSMRTQLHVVAADHEDSDQLHEKNVASEVDLEDVFQYGFLDAIEKRFDQKKQVHIYDRLGEAGLPYLGDDDDEAGNGEEGFSFGLGRRLQAEEDNGEGGERAEDEAEDDDEASNPPKFDLPYPDLMSFINRDEDHVIPYMHVDGTSMENQLEILESARPFMEDNTIVVIGVEHSPDMDVYQLIDFFNSAEYKTFFLGSRQISRIDHLCPEILEDIIRHPSITAPKLTRTARWLKRLGLLKANIDEEDQMRKYPPFFVAMPRGRLNKEEMTIQHMYDLFGGYDGGGGQVQTANDRKAPGKK